MNDPDREQRLLVRSARQREASSAERVDTHSPGSQRVASAISHARVKTDKIDARVLADLLAADLIPNVWIGDDRTRMLRRLVSRRRGLVKRRTQVKNEISAVMHRNLNDATALSPSPKPRAGLLRASRLK